MQLKHLLPLALGAGASAQSLAEALASQNSSLSSLNALLASQPAIVSTLSNATNVTILAPNNDALSAFVNSTTGQAAASEADAIAALLTYHVLQGNYAASAFTNTSQFIPTALNVSAYSNVTGGQRVEARLNGSSVDIFTGLLQESQVVTPHISFAGGTIHNINKVLTIPTSPANTATSLNSTSLAGALAQANLVNAVDSLTDVTIFAPSNAAFQAIGSALGNFSTEQLASILTYHVVNGTVGYSSMLSNTTLTTVGGGQITIRIENGSVFVNSAKVITPDVLVSNGVVHVIDGVLNPNNTSAEPPSSGASTTTGAFTGASSATNVPFTSGITAPQPSPRHLPARQPALPVQEALFMEW